MVAAKSYFILSLQLAFLLIYLPSVGAAQVGSDTTSGKSDNVSDILKKMQDDIQNNIAFPDSILSPPTTGQQQLLDDSTLAIYRNSMRAYYEYRISGFNHRKKVFAWQLFSSRIIFWCVLFLVFSGISFSGIQFYKSFYGEPATDIKVPESVTEFEASASGIKISSPVLGIIILVISLVFFYLYLVYVYPISEIF